jgi:hypothetical protein
MSKAAQGIPAFFHIPGGTPALVSDSRKGPPKDSPAVRRSILMGHALTIGEYYELDRLERMWAI